MSGAGHRSPLWDCSGRLLPGGRREAARHAGIAAPGSGVSVKPTHCFLQQWSERGRRDMGLDYTSREREREVSISKPKLEKNSSE